MPASPNKSAPQGLENDTFLASRLRSRFSFSGPKRGKASELDLSWKQVSRKTTAGEMQKWQPLNQPHLNKSTTKLERSMMLLKYIRATDSA